MVAKIRKDTWQGLEALRKDGVVRQIGVSNYAERHLRELLEYAEVRPAVSQFEVHPFNVREQLVTFCQQEGISVEGYSPLGGKGNPKAVTDNLLRSPQLKKIAKNYGKTVAQVILRWHLQRGVTPIPKSVRKERMKENLAVFDFELTAAEVAEISGLDKATFAIQDSEILL